MSGFMNAVQVALYAKLSAASGLTSLLSGGTADPSIYPGIAPENTDPPYVVYQPQSPSTPVHTMGGVALENALYTVKAVVASREMASAGTIADQIDSALNDQALTVSGHTHLLCRRVQDIDYPETAPGGQVLQHRGAVYRIVADPT